MNASPSEIHPTLTERVRTSRALGADADYVLHGGGNTSAKGTVTNLLGEEVEVMWVKGSGWDLGTIEAPGLPALDLKQLRALRKVDAMTDEVMVREVRRCMLDPSGPTPSVETLLHAFLPHRFIDHSHADAILAVSNRANGVELCQEVFGNRVAYLPYVMPGFPLALAVADLVDDNPDVEGVLLHQHGLFTFAETADESLQRHRELVGLAEARYADAKQNVLAGQATPRHQAQDVLPFLRGALNQETSFVFSLRNDAWILALLDQPNAKELFLTPPLTPDHTIRTKSLPCWLEIQDDVTNAATTAVTSYGKTYQQYFENGCENRGQRQELDSFPRLVLIPGLGMVGIGNSAKAAAIAADIGEHTLLTKAAASDLGTYQGLNDLDLFDMEYWSLEQAKLGKSKPAELAGKVAIITGGGGAIGEGVGRILLEAGACVALLDFDEEAAKAVAKRLGQGALVVKADVTSEESMDAAMEKVCHAFGGLDIIVPNAGVAHSAPLLEHELEDWERLTTVNQTGVFLTLKTAGKILRRQNQGGSVVVISSKNVLAPGAEFSAYSASKAGAHQLAKVAALEWAPNNVTVNLVCPDAVFRDGENSSGLWDEIGPDRAASRGLSPGELESFYRDRSLLKQEVTADDVGRAVLFFAARRTPTTGGVLNVDGGVASAFPR
ncbi:MAG: bifunctional aldolase/short-chain dehydrogenase [Planctomycetes bacterium]|nr:bifunctional aldolase/short-chain dehydrogenase [Planctomycetota bacterium]